MNVLKAVIAALLLTPAIAFADNANKAKIITSSEKPAECISAVHVNRIDDREVKVQKLGFEIDPGKHTMSARTIMNTSFCKVVGIGGRGIETAQPIEADFEAGKTYYLGYDHSASNRRDWKLVIWKVEDSNQG